MAEKKNDAFQRNKNQLMQNGERNDLFHHSPTHKAILSLSTLAAEALQRSFARMEF
jgi:hypothetical protein